MTETTTEIKEKIIKLPPLIVIKELAEKLAVPITDVLKELMKNGIVSSMNEAVDYETATIIADDFGFKAILEKEEAEDESIETVLKEEDTAKLQPRPPVVVVMGHVDHGKTKLLDAIRKTNLVDEEAGGITQKIGAYQTQYKNQTITFIDTPGHEAFTAMRSRGARIADIAILVIAADDGFQPQTKEAIKIIQETRLPFIVAVNKIDKEPAGLERIKKQLAEMNLLTEDWGGKTICVPVSAKNNIGIKELLEMILLVADMEKENIKANPDRSAVGTIIESHLDRGEGPAATCLVQAGTLTKGDSIVVGGSSGKIKMMKDYLNKELLKAGPSTPVKIMGLKSLPAVGEIMQAVADLKSLRKTLKHEHFLREKKKLVRPAKKATGEEKGKKKIKKLNLVLKADSLGSQEAIIASLEKFKLEEVGLEIIAKGLGNINEKDILRAETSNAIVLGFNTNLAPGAQNLMKEKTVPVKTYKIIYDLINEVKNELEKLLEPELIHIELGRVKILAIFRTEKTHMIVGGKVTEGKAANNFTVRVLRNKEEVGQGKITQLQQNKKNAAEVGEGEECGMKFSGPPIVQAGDILEVFKEETKAKKIIINQDGR